MNQLSLFVWKCEQWHQHKTDWQLRIKSIPRQTRVASSLRTSGLSVLEHNQLKAACIRYQSKTADAHFIARVPLTASVWIQLTWLSLVLQFWGSLYLCVHIRQHDSLLLFLSSKFALCYMREENLIPSVAYFITTVCLSTRMMNLFTLFREQAWI